MSSPKVESPFSHWPSKFESTNLVLGEPPSAWHFGWFVTGLESGRKTPFFSIRSTESLKRGIRSPISCGMHGDKISKYMGRDTPKKSNILNTFKYPKHDGFGKCPKATHLQDLPHHRTHKRKIIELGASNSVAVCWWNVHKVHSETYRLQKILWGDTWTPKTYRPKERRSRYLDVFGSLDK